MGITGLNHFINDKSKTIFKTVLLEEIGKSVAIDTTNWIYVPAYEANSRTIDRTDIIKEDLNRDTFLQLLKSLVVEFIKLWIDNGITPYFIFDGKAPRDKDETKSKRQEKTQETKKKILELKEEVKDIDRLLISPSKVAKLKSLMKQDLWISSNEIAQIKELIFSLGFPVIQCVSEGEKLCSALAVHGVVDAVFSTDTDNLTYGAPILINKFVGQDRNSKNKWMPTVRIIKIDELLSTIKLTQSEFVDFCIACGCDYNTHIKGVGPSRVYKLLKEYGDIEKFPSKYNTECLNTKRCRQLFTINDYTDIIDGGNMYVIKNNYISKGKKLLCMMGYESFVTIFDKFYEL